MLRMVSRRKTTRPTSTGHLPGAVQRPHNGLLKQVLPFHLVQAESAYSGHPLQAPELRGCKAAQPIEHILPRSYLANDSHRFTSLQTLSYRRMRSGRRLADIAPSRFEFQPPAPRSVRRTSFHRRARCPQSFSTAAPALPRLARSQKQDAYDSISYMREPGELEPATLLSTTYAFTVHHA